jgi:hypothetical protein
VAQEFGRDFRGLQKIARPPRYPEVRLMPFAFITIFALSLARFASGRIVKGDFRAPSSWQLYC